MLTPTKLGVFGENSLVFTTPDESNAFATLLKRLNCSSNSDHIYADATDAASAVSVTLVIDRHSRPPAAELPAGAPSDLLICNFAVADSSTSTSQPESDETTEDGHCRADFDAALREARALFPEPMHVHHHGRITTSSDRARLTANISIHHEQPKPLGTMLGARFSLDHPEIDHGNAILDTYRNALSVSLSLSFRERFELRHESIQTAWDIVGTIYDSVLSTEGTEEESDGQ